MNAIVYRNPAKVSGGISASPNLIITNDVDQRKVTRSASKNCFQVRVIFHLLSIDMKFKLLISSFMFC